MQKLIDNPMVIRLATLKYCAIYSISFLMSFAACWMYSYLEFEYVKVNIYLELREVSFLIIFIFVCSLPLFFCSLLLVRVLRFRSNVLIANLFVSLILFLYSIFEIPPYKHQAVSFWTVIALSFSISAFFLIFVVRRLRLPPR